VENSFGKWSESGIRKKGNENEFSFNRENDHKMIVKEEGENLFSKSD
jgi:hypothetical protein